MIMEQCRSLVSETIYNVWFKDIELVSFNEEKIVLATTGFRKRMVEAKFMDQLKQAISKIMGFDMTVEIIESAAANDSSGSDDEDKADKDTFETFVVGRSNEFAHSTALSVADMPGKVFNPLLIYGKSGLGKTHLLKAIYNSIKSKHPEMNVIYITGEDFTSELIHFLAHAPSNMIDFHNKYRNADVLLIDDIQFIAGKVSTQEEFFHTFNALVNAGNQIVLTSDVPPKEISTLDDRLRSRFECGLIADIQPPDLETRMAIIKRKADNLNLEMPNEVVEYIAQKLKENIRQLEGAVKKMHAYVTMQGMPTSITTAQAAIKDIIVDNQPKAITVDSIVQEVARTYGVDAADIRSQKQDAATVEIRQMAIYIVRKLTRLSTNVIGQEFGGKNHSTIIYSLKEFEKKLKTRSDLRDKMNLIIKNINEKNNSI